MVAPVGHVGVLGGEDGARGVDQGAARPDARLGPLQDLTLEGGQRLCPLAIGVYEKEEEDEGEEEEEEEEDNDDGDYDKMMMMVIIIVPL
jgi:hypothetical protein